MKKPEKGANWVFNQSIEAEEVGQGVKRKLLAYSDNLMAVENHFDTGAIGALHHHPHTQVTYIVSGKFRFQIGDEEKIVEAGDCLIKEDDIVHGCECIEAGILLDVFNPKRDDFL